MASTAGSYSSPACCGKMPSKDPHRLTGDENNSLFITRYLKLQHWLNHLTGLPELMCKH